MLNGPARVGLDAALAALAQRGGVQIMPGGPVAAHPLGLVNAVPARVRYLMDAHSQTLANDGRTACFRRTGPSAMRWAD